LAEPSTHPVLERKLRSQTAGTARLGVADVWRRVLPRVAEDELGLELSVLSVEEGETTLARALADRTDGSLLLGLSRSGTLCGIAVVDTEFLGALIEVQTTGRVSSSRREARAGTSTDFALLSHVIDSWIAATSEALAAGGAALRCARLFPDSRAVQLGLDDGAFREIRLELDFGGGRRTGLLSILAPKGDSQGAAGPDLVQLRETLLPLATHIDAVLCRVKLPLSRILDLEVGEVVDLEGVSVRKMTLEAPLGHRVSRAHLGQSRGFRAVRILGPSEDVDDDAGQSPSMALPFGQTGLDPEPPDPSLGDEPPDLPPLSEPPGADGGLPPLPSLSGPDED